MNTVLLNQSAASQVIECVPGAHFVFGFPADAAELSRSGNDLVLAFADGASITLEGFYKTYTQQDMPSFEVDGANVAGADFFVAIGQSDLMPAAGPEPANDSHYQEWSNMDLLGGLDRLGGLDVGWKDGGKLPDLDGGGGNDGDINYSVNIFAGEYGSDGPGEQGGRPDDIPEGVRPPGSPDPLDPDADEDDFYPKDPTDPKNDPANMSTTSAHLFVREEDLGGNTLPTDSGWLYISAPDGVASIVIGGFTVWEDGALTGTTRIFTDEGYLEVTAFDEQSGKLEFTYTLTRATQEHSADGADVVFSHALPITVTDTDGESATADITVTIKDDIPTAADDSGVTLEEATVLVDAGQETELASGNAESSGNVLDNDQFGADGKHAADHVDWGTPNINLDKYGTLTLNEDGTWKFVLNTTSETVRAMTGEGDNVTVKVPYTIIDADNDTADAVLTFVIQGADNTVSIIPDSDPDPNYPDPDDPKVDTDPQGDELVVSDAGLTDGSQAGAGTAPTFAHGSMTLLAPDGLKGIMLMLEGQNGSSNKLAIVPLDGGVVSFPLEGTTIVDKIGLGTGDTASQPAGTFTAQYVNGKLVYSFTLNESHQHQPNADAESWNIKLYVTDADGDMDEANIRVTIEDDGPSVKADELHTITEDTTSVSGDVRDQISSGADVNAEGFALQDGSGDYGTLIMHANGDYTYTLNKDAVQHLIPDDKPEDTFSYTYTDADGDTVTGSIVITILGENDGVTIIPDLDPDGNGPELAGDAVIVYEAGLDDGSLPESDAERDSGSFTIDAPDGVASIVLGGVTVYSTVPNADISSTVDTAEGVLTVTGFDAESGKLSYTFQLNRNTTEHNEQGSDIHADSLTLTVTNRNGDSDTDTIAISIVDDVPVFEKAPVTFHTPENIVPSNMQLDFTQGYLIGQIQDKSYAEVSVGGVKAIFHVGEIAYNQTSEAIYNILGNTANPDPTRWVEITDPLTFTPSKDGLVDNHTVGAIHIEQLNETYNNSLGIKGSYVDTTAGWKSEGWISEFGVLASSSNCLAEALSITLTDAKGNPMIAYNLDIDFQRFYGGEREVTERALFLFYKDGELQGSSVISSNDVTVQGTYQSAGIVKFSSGFDEVVIAALPKYGVTDPAADNSDFNIEGLTFNTFTPAVTRAASGVVDAASADGITIYGILTEHWEDAGYTVTTSTVMGGEMSVLVNDGSTNIITVSLNTKTGEWNFYQQGESLPDKLDVLSFTATDGDGDVSTVMVDVSTGNNGLIGDEGMDYLFGNTGNDFLDGNGGSDGLDGGEGSDIFVYDEADAFVQGGTGIDILLSDDSVSLDTLLGSGKVEDVEILVTGDNAESLTSLTALAEVGITVADGKVTLSDAWEQGPDHGFVNSSAHLTIETTLEATEAAGQIELQSIVGG